jgi:cyclopropane fatty-acyl-phospholipid synthase-like methyltransferase
MPQSPERADEYESFYREFDSPLMRQIRLEAYGEDIGQHSWVSADELRGDAVRLGLNKRSGLLDLGSGPCGPLTFLVAHSGCTGVGLELSPSAIEVGRSRAVALGIEARFSARMADLNEPLPPDLGMFDSVVAIDVVLHLHDRLALFREVAKVLRPDGLFLFTDAGIVTGALTSEDVRRRSIHGYTQFVPAGWNERLLQLAGFRLLESEDRTEGVVRNARGRLRAMHNHREDVERLSGVASFAKQVEYTNIVADLAARGSLSRFMYLAKVEQTAG